MITSKKELREFLERDAMAAQRKSIKAKLFGDEVWKYILLLRKYEYRTFVRGGVINTLIKNIYRYRWHRLGVKLGFTISANVFDKGFSIAHYGTIVVHPKARVGENCRIQEGVNIGATNGSPNAPVIGKNVFIGSGAKIIGDIKIADDVAIGAGAVVVRSIEEPGTAWAGVPARKISDNNSHSNLSPLLFGGEKMKIGLMTIHDTMNFGSLLQTYSLYSAVEALGYDIVLVDYKWISRAYTESTYPLSECKSISDVIKSLAVHGTFQKKYNSFWSFIRNNMKVTRPYNSQNIKEANGEADTFLVGSDIVWGLNITGNDFNFFLEFADDSKRKLAFSSSVGTAWQEEDKERIKNCLKRFENITVRETQASEWVNELIGISPEVTCDPTMLWDREKWLKMAEHIPQSKEKYMLVYFTAEKKQNLTDAIEYGRKKNLPVYYINYGRPVKGVKNIKPMTVEEWIALIRDADTVFSASYHGLLYSLYLHTRVFYYNKTNKSRMASLSAELKIASREGTADNLLQDSDIDFDHVDSVLKQKREKNHRLLKEILEERK